MPVTIGISQMIQTMKLNLWNCIFLSSFYPEMTMVAQMAWNNIKRMAVSPVSP